MQAAARDDYSPTKIILSAIGICRPPDTPLRARVTSKRGSVPFHPWCSESGPMDWAAMDWAAMDRPLSIRHAYLEGVDEEALERCINDFVEALRSHSGSLIALERPRLGGELRVAKVLYALPIDRH